MTQQAAARDLAGSRREDSNAALPGERVTDEELVRAAVFHLNRLQGEAALTLAFETGEYVLATFFDGRPERFRQCRTRHASFRRLAAHEALHSSASFLYTAVAVVEQARQLPPQLVRRLSLSHQRLLLPVKNQEVKRALAERAVTECLSKRQMAEELQQYLARTPRGKRRGRPAVPAAVKTLNRVRKATNQLLDMKDSDLDLGDYSPHATRELLLDLMKELEQVTEVVARLHQRLRRRSHPAAVSGRVRRETAPQMATG